MLCTAIVLFLWMYFIDHLSCAYQVKLGELEAELIELNANGEKLQRTYNELVEYKLVLEKVWLHLILQLIDDQSSAMITR